MGRVDRRQHPAVRLATSALAALACIVPAGTYAEPFVQQAGATTIATGLHGHAAARCAAKTIKTATGPTRMRFVLHGPVSCAAAHRTLVSYFARVPDECLGSGCYIKLPTGWSCETAPGEVTRETGEITTCERRHATIKTYMANRG